MQAMLLRVDWSHKLKVMMKAKGVLMVIQDQSPLRVGDHVEVKVMARCCVTLVVIATMMMRSSSPEEP